MPGTANRRPPNLVVAVSHDLGGHLNCCGAATVNSPALDRLATEASAFRGDDLPRLLRSAPLHACTLQALATGQAAAAPPRMASPGRWVDPA